MRGCLVKVGALVLAVLLFGTYVLPEPDAVAAHDVERDGQSCGPSALVCYPFIGPVQGADAFGGEFTVTLQPHAGVRGQWQCLNGVIDNSVALYNFTGTTNRVLTYTVPTLNQTDHDLNVSDRCWYIVTAVSSPDNVYSPRGFLLNGASYWIDYPDDPGGEDPFPEATPTPTPTPTPGPAYREATCTTALITGLWRGGAKFSPDTDLVAGDVFRIDWLGTDWGEGAASNLNVQVVVDYGEGGEGALSTPRVSPTPPSNTLQPYVNVSYPNPLWGGAGVTGNSTTVQASQTAPDIGFKCTNSGSGDSSMSVRGRLYLLSGPSVPTPTPTPTPTPEATPLPPDDDDPPPPDFTGFDVCASQYTASEKLMCQPPPFDFGSDVTVEICDPADPDYDDLAICQPVEDWGDGPAGGGGGNGDGAPSSAGGVGSGLTECPPTPVEEKVGFIPYGEVPDVDDLAARVTGKDPLAGLGESIGWLGDMVWTLPDRIGNGIKWAYNAAVDAFVPGECIEELLEARWTELQGDPPLSIYVEVNDAITAAIGTASAASLVAMPLPGGGSVDFPLDMMEAAIGPYRGIMGALTWLLGAVAVLRIVVGSFGVSSGGGYYNGGFGPGT